MTVSIHATGLSKAYRDGDRRVEVLDDASITVPAGMAAAVVGPSGSGKSTLLHLLGALERPDAGEVTIGDTALGRLDSEALARFRNRTIGFVFQFHQLLPDFDAVENVMLPGRISGLAARECHSRARELLAEVGLAERLDHFPNQLSGGERQRVALCRALFMEPPLLLADEPTGNLDPASAERVIDLLLALQARRGTTLVLVTHNPVIAGRCGSLFSLAAGRVHGGQPTG
ncbi:MAG: ABC transporter ATP-binding protein [Acidobacteriota bacterium]